MATILTILRRSILLFAACLPAVAHAQSDAGQDERVRLEFIAAYALARAGLPPLGSDSEALERYVIYPYLEAARLGRRVGAAGPGLDESDDAVESFLGRHGDAPVTANLRIAWLQSLARRELWPEFLANYEPESADTTLRCQFIQARIAENQVADIAPLIIDEWLTPFRLPIECEPVFQWLRDDGRLDEALTEARVVLLLESGQAAFARVIAGRLSEERARPLIAWADLIERPLSSIEAFIAGPSPDVAPAMLLDGWSRLCRDDPDSALELHHLLITTQGLQGGDANAYTLALALGLAWDRRPEALEYFALVDEAAMDDYALTWQTRAALWAGDWDTARAALSRMSPAELGSSQWRYWSARASEDRDQRSTLLRSILPNDNYFSAAASRALREPAEPHAAPSPPDPDLIETVAGLPGIARAVELWHVGLPVAATREWRQATDPLDRAEREHGMHLAMRIGWFDLAVATATELGVFFDYEFLYPRPFADEVAAAAHEFDLDPSLIESVMRQESLFRVDAESSAGARGLMQLQRGTAEGILRRLGEPVPAGFDLLDPATNIRLGAAELRRMLDRYDGHIAVALAAYNAGPAAADRWLPDRSIAGDIWLENVPYNETREYVRRVLWHSTVYAWLRGDRADVRDWLREVDPP